MSGRSKARKPNRITALRKTVASLSCISRSVSGVILIFSNGSLISFYHPSWSERTSRCRGSASHSILWPIVTVGNPSQNSVKNCQVCHLGTSTHNGKVITMMQVVQSTFWPLRLPFPVSGGPQSVPNVCPFPTVRSRCRDASAPACSSRRRGVPD